MAGLLLSLANRMNPETTDIDRWKCERVVPLEVLVLGCSRTGTSSIREALKMMGYNDVYHARCFYVENPRDADMWMDAIRAKFDDDSKTKWTRAEWDKLLGHCMAVSDIPCTFFTEELINAYPEAKVIISLRDSPEAWWTSVEKTLIPMTEGFYNKTLWMKIYRFFLPRFRFNDLNDEILRRSSTEEFVEKGSLTYIEHNDLVREKWNARQEKHPTGGGLLEYNVKQGWGPLCEFLDKPVPKDENGEQVPFPRKNDAATFNETSKGTKKFLDSLVAFNMTATAVSFATIAYTARLLYRKRANGTLRSGGVSPMLVAGVTGSVLCVSTMMMSFIQTSLRQKSQSKLQKPA